MAFDTNKLTVSLPDQVRVFLNISPIRDSMTMPMDEWNDLSPGDKQKRIKDWVIEVALDAAIVTVAAEHALPVWKNTDGN